MLVIFLSACGGDEEDKKGNSSSTSSESQDRKIQERNVQEKTAPVVPPVPALPKIPNLADYARGRVAEQSVMIRAEGQPDLIGVLVRGDGFSSGQYEYQVICDLPSAPKSILCATKFGGGAVAARATRLAALPGGLQVYSFSSSQLLLAYTIKSGGINEPVYACRLEITKPISDEERIATTEKLASLRAQLDEQRMNSTGMRPQQGRRISREELENVRRSHQDAMRKQVEFSREIPQLEARLNMAVGGINAIEVASAANTEGFDHDASALAGTVLVGRDGGLLAIRHGGNWVYVKELLESATGKPSQVTLNISGSKNSLNLSCSLDWALAFGKTGCSIVVATTFELESMDGGSLEERLAKLKPEPMSTSRSKSILSKNLRWNGEPTSLWIRVFQDSQPNEPIIDEIIKIDYTDRFQAKWGRPPSPLIAIPQPELDTPPDLAGKPTTLDAGGTILDLVAAGDGSVLMVQTDKPPFWQPLDLKTGHFLETSWKAGPETLLAAQAGKIHLIDRKMRMVETWDLKGNTRTGLQILQLDGDIVAVAGALSAVDAPLLITTTKEGVFVDPIKFEILSNGFDMTPCFSKEKGYHGVFPKLVPESIRLRASHDGTLFSVSGTDASGQGGVRSFRIIVDPTSAARADSSSGGNFLPSRGRWMTDSFPDHGGSGIKLRTMSGSNSFPGPAGTISFMTDGNKEILGVLRGSPIVPADPRNAKGPLARDRGLYFDATQGVLAVPEDSTLHLIPVNLPSQPAAVPQFTFAGETVSIPLPKGSNHNLVSSIGGDVVVGDNEILWKVPDGAQSDSAGIKLEWNGELGSAMSSSLNYSIIAQASGLIVESADGKTRLPLRRTGVMADPGGDYRFAGSGNVLLTSARNALHVWSLTDCRRLFSVDETRNFIGDADHVYTLSDDGRLRAYDLQTGGLVKEAVLGKSQNGRQALTGITTGISSRLPLLAAERDGHESYLQLIDRLTLEPTLLDFSKETQRRFFIPQFQTNPSGSATWSLNVAVSRQGNEITVQPFDNVSVGGTPDESGRYVVSSDGVYDMLSNPPVMTNFEDLPDGDRFSYFGFDVSGRYVLLRLKQRDEEAPAISVRDVRAPGVELFKIIFPMKTDVHGSRLISGAGKLICNLDRNFSRKGVFEFDVPTIIRELAESSQNR